MTAGKILFDPELQVGGIQHTGTVVEGLKALMRKEKNNDNNEDRVGHSDQLTGTECKEPQSACSLINGPQKIMNRKEESEVMTG